MFQSKKWCILEILSKSRLALVTNQPNNCLKMEADSSTECLAGLSQKTEKADTEIKENIPNQDTSHFCDKLIPSEQNMLQQCELTRLEWGHHVICESGFSGTLVEQAQKRSGPRPAWSSFRVVAQPTWPFAG